MIGDNRRHSAVYGKYFSLLCLLSDAPGFCAKAAQNAAVSVQGRKEKVPTVETCGIVWGIRLRSSVSSSSPPDQEHQCNGAGLAWSMKALVG